MKLDPPPPPFSLFSTQLPTDERTEFSSRADSIFANLNPTSISAPVPPDIMMPPPAIPTQRRNDQSDTNVDRSEHTDNNKKRSHYEMYSSTVSDRVNTGDCSHPRNKGKRSYRDYKSDHELNPEKYTSYSLSDTTLADDRQNKAVGLSFINELEKRKQSSEVVEEADLNKGIVFKKRDKAILKESVQSTKVVKSNANVHVQEEYVVGQTSSKSHKHRNVAALSIGDKEHRPVLKGSPTIKLAMEEEDVLTSEEEEEGGGGNIANIVKDEVEAMETIAINKSKRKRNIRKKKDEDDVED